MKKSLRAIRKSREQHSKVGALFREFILGGQDGLVNVLGILLGMAIATQNSKLVIIAGLAAAFAESFSMAAVAYTSVKAEEDFYKSQEQKELCEIKESPESEKEEIYNIYHKKGFRGKILNDIVNHITSNKKIWVNMMMKEELGMSNEFISPLKSMIVVGMATIIGSIIPLLSFFFFPITTAIYLALIISAIALFVAGAIEGKFTVGHWVKKGFQLMIIGMVAAGIGFLVGKVLGVSL
jgi:predicted membrane protein (TIGR00267 family)